MTIKGRIVFVEIIFIRGSLKLFIARTPAGNLHVFAWGNSAKWGALAWDASLNILSSRGAVFPSFVFFFATVQIARNQPWWHFAAITALLLTLSWGLTQTDRAILTRCLPWGNRSGGELFRIKGFVINQGCILLAQTCSSLTCTNDTLFRCAFAF